MCASLENFISKGAIKSRMRTPSDIEALAEDWIEKMRSPCSRADLLPDVGALPELSKGRGEGK